MITRAREFNQITIYDHTDKEIKSMEDSKVRIDYIENKIVQYKEQDIKAGRKISKNYIDVNWFYAEMKKQPFCKICNERWRGV